MKFSKFLRTTFLQNSSGGCFWTAQSIKLDKGLKKEQAAYLSKVSSKNDACISVSLELFLNPHDTEMKFILKYGNPSTIFLIVPGMF